MMFLRVAFLLSSSKSGKVCAKVVLSYVVEVQQDIFLRNALPSHFPEGDGYTMMRLTR